MKNTNFLDFVQYLREKEEVILFQNILEVDELEALEVSNYLQEAYQTEIIDYPFEAPAFDEVAALWAAKTIYFVAQLILYRQNEVTEMEALLPSFSGKLTPSSILSIDLCLRFLPDMLTQLKLIDPEDELISLLKQEMTIWHYSGINHGLDIENLNFDPIFDNPCVQQLYLNRIIAFKNKKLAQHPLIKDLILADIGMHKTVFWKNLA